MNTQNIRWGKIKNIYSYLRLTYKKYISHIDPNSHTLTEISSFNLDQCIDIIIYTSKSLIKTINIDLPIFCLENTGGQEITDELILNISCEKYEVNLSLEERHKVLSSHEDIGFLVEKISMVSIDNIEYVFLYFPPEPISYLRSTLNRISFWKKRKKDPWLGEFNQRLYLIIKYLCWRLEYYFKNSGNRYIVEYIPCLIKVLNV